MKENTSVSPSEKYLQSIISFGASNFSPAQNSILNSYLVKFAILQCGAEVDIEKVENCLTEPPSLPPGFIPKDLTVTKLNYDISADEDNQIADYKYFRENLSHQRTVLASLKDDGVTKIVHPADRSRYFPKGRKRACAIIHQKMGRRWDAPAVIFTPTFDPKLISRDDAWHYGPKMCSECIRYINIWRGRHHYPKVDGYLRVVEPQPKMTHYPHFHIVYPYQKWIAPTAVLTEIWRQVTKLPMPDNAVDVKYRDQISLVGYACKYVTKMDGWSDLSTSYLWKYRKRLYTMSNRYRLPYSDGGHREPEWKFLRVFSEAPQVSLAELDRRLAELNGNTS